MAEEQTKINFAILGIIAIVAIVAVVALLGNGAEKRAITDISEVGLVDDNMAGRVYLGDWAMTPGACPSGTAPYPDPYEPGWYFCMPRMRSLPARL